MVGTAGGCQPPAVASIREEPAGRDRFGPQLFMQCSVNRKRGNSKQNRQEEMLWSQQGMKKPFHVGVAAGEVDYLTLKRTGKARKAIGPDCSEELMIFSWKGHQCDFHRTSALN